jgi:hypothetical protein
MTSSQEQLTELTRRTQEGFKHLWQQWAEKSSELMKGMTSRTHAAPPAATKGQQLAGQATEAPMSAPSTAESASAGPMGPGHSSSPEAESASGGPVGPGHSTRPDDG